MTDLGLLFSMDENGVITLNKEELKVMVTDFIYFPENTTVQNDFMLEVIEGLNEVVLGNKTLQEIVTEVYDSKGYEYACRIVEDSVHPVSAEDFDTFYKELEKEAVEEMGTTLYSGMGLSDINIEDIYANICVYRDSPDDLLGGLLEIESIVQGKQESGLKLVVYKFVETGMYMGYIA